MSECHYRIGAVNEQAAETEPKLKQLYDSIETDSINLNDNDLKVRIVDLKKIKVSEKDELSFMRQMVRPCRPTRSYQPSWKSLLMLHAKSYVAALTALGVMNICVYWHKG